MSEEQFQAFMLDLQALCAKHNARISAEYGYDCNVGAANEYTAWGFNECDPEGWKK